MELFSFVILRIIDEEKKFLNPFAKIYKNYQSQILNKSKLKPEHYGLNRFFTTFLNPFSQNKKNTTNICV